MSMEQAITLRNEGKLKKSNKMLLELLEVTPSDAYLNYQCAWSFDVLGEEANAVPYYEKAIKLGLSEKDLEGALLGLGSTYRTLGLYENSKQTLLHGMERFPNNRAIQVFFAMTLYNLNEHSASMDLLLKCLTETTEDQGILMYKKAIDFYSDKLDQVWK
ncbi:tetratricopeptide repeat protein [Ornithinibacillus sp. L9]|uniref:Tetratricopeptide repeat protein n=1 Tax=Ornithinibacillus caprae TaxID=2678566 RepID=A0A6N8FEP4_9BACI|nr:tetratricopeptide repeat protein [Ornithinibacillus caprae]MUK87993.1 tetratricopeptide repeat protein [Ornithinibacillus caprae]